MATFHLSDQLQFAVDLALSGGWDEPHCIVQQYNTAMACWIHAVLHKIEGDAWNSRYWYARTRFVEYENFSSPQDELREIARRLSQET